MDPMSRILLEKSYEAVVDAGTYIMPGIEIDLLYLYNVLITRNYHERLQSEGHERFKDWRIYRGLL